VKKFLTIILAILFLGCGSNSSNNPNAIEEENNLSFEDNKNYNFSSKVITIYVHGYQEEGYKRDNTYGLPWYNTFRENLEKYTKLPSLHQYNYIEKYSNMLTSIDYYGKNAPEYYSEEDIQDIEDITQKFKGGIPRYAMIIAKYAKDLLEHTPAEKINIVSVSMGSLITRWMIEKDLEHLASEKKIEKWITLEGVIRGNYALSVANETIIHLFLDESPEIKQMHYNWIKENLTPTPEILSNNYYKDILVGQISLTDGTQSGSLLKYVLPLYGGFQPNDGFQLLKDTYFAKIEQTLQPPSHILLHEDHVNIKNSVATMINVANFLNPKKRVRITLEETTVNDIHEDVNSKNQSAEILFESKIYSPYSDTLWDLHKAIDERLYYSGALQIYNYQNNGEKKRINQILFDGFIDQKEEELELYIQGFEIDRSSTYNISEINKVSKKESLGKIDQYIPLKNGTYPIESDDWQGVLKIEILEI